MKKIFLCFLLSIFLLSAISAQSQKGKISGRIVDELNNEPLTGTNIIVVGTPYGSVADLNGRYNILNLPPGTYSVKASMIGYRQVTVKSVQVFIDRTTELNFKLKPQDIQGEAIEVIAEKPKIIKDQTSSSTTIDNEQISTAPIEGIRGIMDFSTSFQKNEKGDYQVRGSGTNEVSFQINGVEQSNSNNAIPAWGNASEKVNNTWKYDVNPLGVQQLQLISGGFTAEYGNAQAAVVKAVMKEGGPKITGEVRAEFRPPGQYHWGNYIYDKSSFEWKTWGNADYWLRVKDSILLKPGGTILTQLGLDRRYQSLYTKISTGQASADEKQKWDSIATNEVLWAHQQWVKLHTPSEDNPLGVYDYRNHFYKRIMVGFGGYVSKNPDLLRFYFSGEYKGNPTRLPTPERDQISQNYMLNLTSQAIKDHKFKFLGSFQKYTGGLFSGSDDIRWAGLSNIVTSYKYFVSRDPVRTEQTVSLSLNWIYSITNNSFLETNISHQYEKYELPYKYLLTWYDEKDRLDGSDDSTGVLLTRGDWWDQTYFNPYENIATDFFQDNRSLQWTISGDYTNQFTPSNLFKSGVKLSYWDLTNNGVTYNFKANSYLTQQGVAEYYRAYPIQFSAYLQDKMEYEGMIANLGVRMEAYNFQVNAPSDRFNIFYQGTLGPGRLGSLLTTPTTTKYVFLPRLGLSFPVGEATALRMQYGHFASMPLFAQALGNSTFYGWTARGNPNLDFKKTINYELGLQQLLDDYNRLDIAIYYNDRVTQIGYQAVAAYTGDARESAGFANDNSPLFIYDSFANRLFGSTIGLEVNLESVGGGSLNYKLSYSLSQTTDGFYGSPVIYPENSSQQETRINSTERLSPYDRTHSFRGLVQYQFKEKEGLNILGVNLLENSVFSLSYTIQSGTPFTYITEFGLQDVFYNRRYPLESSWDFNFIKNINIGDIRVIFGIRIMNLFDNKWLTPMDSKQEIEDRDKWVKYGITIDQPDAENKRSLLLYPFRAYRNLPRQIFFTLGIGV